MAHAKKKFVQITMVPLKKGAEEIHGPRRKEAKPILEKLKAFLLKHQDAVPPKDLLSYLSMTPYLSPARRFGN